MGAGCGEIPRVDPAGADRAASAARCHRWSDRWSCRGHRGCRGRGRNWSGRLVTSAYHLAAGHGGERSESREHDAADRCGSAAESCLRRDRRRGRHLPRAHDRRRSAQAAAFRSATSDLFTGLLDVPIDPAPAPTLDLATLKTTRLAVSTLGYRGSAHPVAAYVCVTPPWKGSRSAGADHGRSRRFRSPCTSHCAISRRISSCPGSNSIKPDTLGLLLTNPRFIEGYMVGLNFEMARQLLWNDYPTDQRGSYFRQFWDVSAYVPQPSDPTDPAALVGAAEGHSTHSHLAAAYDAGDPSQPNGHCQGQPRAAGTRRAVQALSDCHCLRWKGASSTITAIACWMIPTSDIRSSEVLCPTTSPSSASISAGKTRRAEPRNHPTASSSSFSSSHRSRASDWSRWKTATPLLTGPTWHGRTSVEAKARRSSYLIWG